MSERKISNESFPSRLFAKDTLHIKRKVKEAGATDTRFKDKTSAVRYYVQLGISTEKRTNSANTLDDKIIIASQKEVVTDSLLPLKHSIDDLITVMQNFDHKQSEHFRQSNNWTEALIGRIEALNQSLNVAVGNLLNEILRSGKVSDESLRNIIVLRSIHYIFLLGYKTGNFDPNEKISWNEVILFAHKKAQELSITELQHLNEGTYEDTIVKKLAGDIFKEIQRLKRS